MAGAANDDPPPLIGAGVVLARSVVGRSAPAEVDVAATERAESTPMATAPRHHLGALMNRRGRMARWTIRILGDSFVLLGRRILHGRTDFICCVGSLTPRLPLMHVGCATER